MSLFKKAERKRAKLKIAGTGPSGSGKTYSLLQLATGLGKKIALVDTENESASLYADRFEFDTINLEPPFTVKKYIEAIEAAEKEGYDVLIIDSLSHAWAGEGGILERKSAKDSQGGNSYTNWAQFTKEQEELKSAILYADLHILASMRSKQDYIVEQNEKGKSAPRKVGMAPIQREGMEYEFTVVFDFSMDHSFHVSKDRTGLFDSRIEKMKPDHGQELLAWLGGAKAEAPKKQSFVRPASTQAAQSISPVTAEDRLQKFKVPDDAGEYIISFGKKYKGKKLNEVPENDVQGFISWCEKNSQSSPPSFEVEELKYAFNLMLEQRADQLPMEDFA